MPLTSAAALLDDLGQHRLLDAARLAEARAMRPAGDARALAGELIRRGWLTPYQVNQLAQGKGA